MTYALQLEVGVLRHGRILLWLEYVVAVDCDLRFEPREARIEDGFGCRPSRGLVG